MCTLTQLRRGASWVLWWCLNDGWSLDSRCYETKREKDCFSWNYGWYIYSRSTNSIMNPHVLWNSKVFHWTMSVPRNFRNSSFRLEASLDSPTHGVRRASIRASRFGYWVLRAEGVEWSHSFSMVRRHPLTPSTRRRGFALMASRSSIDMPSWRPMSSHFTASPLRTVHRVAKSLVYSRMSEVM